MLEEPLIITESRFACTLFFTVRVNLHTCDVLSSVGALFSSSHMPHVHCYAREQYLVNDTHFTRHKSTRVLDFGSCKTGVMWTLFVHQRTKPAYFVLSWEKDLHAISRPHIFQPMCHLVHVGHDRTFHEFLCWVVLPYMHKTARRQKMWGPYIVCNPFTQLRTK